SRYPADESGNSDEQLRFVGRRALIDKEALCFVGAWRCGTASGEPSGASASVDRHSIADAGRASAQRTPQIASATTRLRSGMSGGSGDRVRLPLDETVSLKNVSS